MPIFFVKSRKEDVPGTGDITVDPPIPPKQVDKYDVFREGKSTREDTFDTEEHALRKMKELEEAETALAPVSSEASTQEAPETPHASEKSEATETTETTAPGKPPFQLPKLENIKDKLAKRGSTASRTTKKLKNS